MLKMDLAFEDFNGNNRVETHYFNMTKTESTRLQLKHSTLVGDDTVVGGFMEFLEAVRERGSGEEMSGVIEDLILSAYGIKSEDGRKFEKSQAIRDDFVQTAAYDALFVQLMTDPQAMENFFQQTFNVDKYEEADADKPNRPYPSAPQQPQVSQTPLAINDMSENSTNIVVDAPASEPTPEQIAEYLRNKNGGGPVPA